MNAVDCNCDTRHRPAPSAKATSCTGNDARILIVDDFPVVRDGLAQIIDQQPGLRCIARAGSAEETLAALEKKAADLVIVDISLGRSNGLDLMRTLRCLHPRLRSLALSMHNESLYAEYALNSGARGYVMKEEVTDSIVQAMHCVLCGGVYLSERMARRMLSRLKRTGGTKSENLMDNLSRLQQTIFEMLGRNHETSTIAGELDLTPERLENEMGEIRARLHLDSQYGLEAMAVLAVQNAVRSD